jgi:hypothetical protein
MQDERISSNEEWARFQSDVDRKSANNRALTQQPPLQMMAVGGIEELDQLDGEQMFTLPVWKLRHSGHDAGMFANTVTGEIAASIEAVVVSVTPSRFNWPRPYNPKVSDPLCYSIDAMRPVDQQSAAVQGFGVQGNVSVCCRSKAGVCPAAQWIGGQSPECALILNYLVVDVGTLVPGVIRFSRGAMAAAKALNSLIRAVGFARTIVFSAEMVTSKAGFQYFTPTFTLGNETPADLLPVIQSMSAIQVVQIIGGTEPDYIEVVSSDTGEVTAEQV